MTDHEPRRGAWDPTTLFAAGDRPAPPTEPTRPPDPATVPMAAAAAPHPVPPPFNPAGYGGPAPDQLQPVAPARPYGRLPLIVAALTVLLLAGAVGGVVLMRSTGRGDTGTGTGSGAGIPQLPTETVATPAAPTGTAPADTGPAGNPSAGDPPTEAADPQADALARLEELSREGLAAVTIEGQFVAQIASKYPGVSDPYQVAADGSHTFRATDILAEHQRLRDGHGSDEHPVILLRSTDYGKRQLVAGQPLWVTFATGYFPGKQAVLDWCTGHFGQLPAAELRNQCDARTLRPAA